MNFNRALRWSLLLALPVVAYPVFVLGSVYAYWFAADLPGGRNGPSDAYRHSLASATVAYTATPTFVEWVTAAMEDEQRSQMSAMDIHNNRIGARIGANAPSWKTMHEQVWAAVQAGEVNSADPDRITWLPPERWLRGVY